MNAAKPGEFDKAAFIAAVKKAIAAQAPKNLDEADKFGDSGKADEVKGEVQGKVTDGKKARPSTIDTTTAAPPDTSPGGRQAGHAAGRRTGRQPPPGTPDAANAVPDKAAAGGDRPLRRAQPGRPADGGRAGHRGAAGEVQRAGVHRGAGSEEGRASSTRPPPRAGCAGRGADPGRRQGGGGSRRGGARWPRWRRATASSRAAVGGGQERRKSRGRGKRAQVTATLQKVFDATKKDVEAILTGLDKKVDEQFSRGREGGPGRVHRRAQAADGRVQGRALLGLLGKAPLDQGQVRRAARRGQPDLRHRPRGLRRAGCSR